MSNSVTNNRALFALLIGGLLFMIVAIGLVILLLSQPPTPQPVVILVTATPPDPPPTSTPEQKATPTPTPSPSLTPRPEPTSTPTLTPISAAGDKLSLPTATLVPSPTPTNTPAPTPTSAPLPVSQPVEGLRIGDIAPDFTLGSNRASRVSLSGLRGKIVILNFWATWCPPCRYEVPALQAIHNELGPQGVVVLAINEGEKLENVERFAHDNKISFAVWLDEDRWAGNIYQVRAIPTTYFIDGQGVIRDIQIGSMSQDQIIAKLEKLL
ncbi:MAG: hypothetical protein DPW09_35585 [Anaerolineae bacterium]|nr:redoxin domain-containing protein [Anaerolineales bacterium]MCQ3978776.1 hypothetical protein [Anaerolineae bacterium]